MSFCFSWPLRVVLDELARARDYDHRQISSFLTDSARHFRLGEIVANYGQPYRVQKRKNASDDEFRVFLFYNVLFTFFLPHSSVLYYRATPVYTVGDTTAAIAHRTHDLSLHIR